VISAELNQPQVWCKLSTAIFDVYEVDSLRDNTISLELNVEQLLQVLKQYEKSNSDELAIRLQKKTEANSSKRSASLGLFFVENVSLMSASPVHHSYNIPVRLLKRETDSRITEPELSNVDVMMRLPNDISLLFKRIERYKTSEYLKVIGTNHGSLSLNINDSKNMNLTITWNQELEVPQSDGSLDDIKHEILVRLKDWKLGTRICEVCKNMVLIISHDEALVLHCYLDDEETCEIIYFINGVNQ
jgi:G2-specific checkpoint protein